MDETYTDQLLLTSSSNSSYESELYDVANDTSSSSSSESNSTILRTIGSLIIRNLINSNDPIKYDTFNVHANQPANQPSSSSLSSEPSSDDTLSSSMDTVYSSSVLSSSSLILSSDTDSSASALYSELCADLNVTSCSIDTLVQAANQTLNSTTGGDELRPDKVYWALCLTLLPFLAIFGNILVIASVYKEKSLQSVTNYFIVSLAVADLLVAAIVMPFAVYYLVSAFHFISHILLPFLIAARAINSVTKLTLLK